MVIWALYYIACGLFCPIYFLLGILGPFAFLGLPWPFSELYVPMRFYQLLWASLTQLSYPSSLGLMGFPSAPYFLYLHYFRLAIAHSYFSTSHIAHGFATSLSPSSFRPIWFLKAHLFISWVWDPLFLPLGLDGFSIHLLTLFCPCCWASSFN